MDVDAVLSGGEAADVHLHLHELAAALRDLLREDDGAGHALVALTDTADTARTGGRRAQGEAGGERWAEGLGEGREAAGGGPWLG